MAKHKIVAQFDDGILKIYRKEVENPGELLLEYHSPTMELLPELGSTWADLALSAIDNGLGDFDDDLSIPESALSNPNCLTESDMDFYLEGSVEIHTIHIHHVLVHSELAEQISKLLIKLNITTLKLTNCLSREEFQYGPLFEAISTSRHLDNLCLDGHEHGSGIVKRLVDQNPRAELGRRDPNGEGLAIQLANHADRYTIGQHFYISLGEAIAQSMTLTKFSFSSSNYDYDDDDNGSMCELGEIDDLSGYLLAMGLCMANDIGGNHRLTHINLTGQDIRHSSVIKLIEAISAYTNFAHLNLLSGPMFEEQAVKALANLARRQYSLVEILIPDTDYHSEHWGDGDTDYYGDYQKYYQIMHQHLAMNNMLKQLLRLRLDTFILCLDDQYGLSWDLMNLFIKYFLDDFNSEYMNARTAFQASSKPCISALKLTCMTGTEIVTMFNRFGNELHANGRLSILSEQSLLNFVNRMENFHSTACIKVTNQIIPCLRYLADHIGNTSKAEQFNKLADICSNKWHVQVGQNLVMLRFVDHESHCKVVNIDILKSMSEELKKRHLVTSVYIDTNTMQLKVSRPMGEFDHTRLGLYLTELGFAVSPAPAAARSPTFFASETRKRGFDELMADGAKTVEEGDVKRVKIDDSDSDTELAVDSEQGAVDVDMQTDSIDSDSEIESGPMEVSSDSRYLGMGM